MPNPLAFRPIVTEDKPLFNAYFSRFQPTISEYTFSNLHIWRKSKKTLFAEWNGALIIKAEHEGHSYFMPPIGWTANEKNKKTEQLIQLCSMSDSPQIFRRMGEADIEGLDPEKFIIEEDRNNFDYVYATSDLAGLKGRKYDGKRGFVSKFMDNYDYQAVHYEGSLKLPCLRLAEQWASDRNAEGVDEELDAIREYMEHFAELGCCGFVLRDGEKIIGFTFGEKLNFNTFVVHFEKCDTSYIGAYQTINHLFAQNEIHGNFEFINREQDLGIEGVRKAKMSYHPAMLVKKYTVRIKS